MNSPQIALTVRYMGGERIAKLRIEEISGWAHRFDSSSRRVDLNQRIKSLSLASSWGFLGVCGRGQATCLYFGELGGTALNCNRNCNPGFGYRL